MKFLLLVFLFLRFTFPYGSTYDPDYGRKLNK